MYSAYCSSILLASWHPCLNRAWPSFTLRAHCPRGNYNLCASITTFDSYAATLISHVLFVLPPQIQSLHLSHQHSFLEPSAIWHNNGGKWSMTRIRDSKNASQLQLSMLFSPFVLFEWVSLSVSRLPFVPEDSCRFSATRSSSFSPWELSLYFKQIFCIFFCLFMLSEQLASDNLLANCCG